MRTLYYKDKSLQTEWTDREVADRCRQLNNNFAQELVAKYDNAVSRGRTLSDGQLYWLHKLAQDKERPTAPAVSGFKKVLDLFDKVKTRIQFPTIHLSLPTASGRQQDITLKLASTKSRYPGNINVTDNGKFGSSVWYGRITSIGNFVKSADCTDDIAAILWRFAQDPVAVAREHGHLNNRCCFCGATLEDSRSIAAGYGPTCADNYGLPWGDERATIKTVAGPVQLLLFDDIPPVPAGLMSGV